MHSGILIYALYGAGTSEWHDTHIKRFEATIADSKVLQMIKPDHAGGGTLVLYFDDTEKALAAVSKCVYRFLQKLFNSDVLPEEVADYAEITVEQCQNHMKTDEYPSFAWSFAANGRLYGSQIYLV